MFSQGRLFVVLSFFGHPFSIRVLESMVLFSPLLASMCCLIRSVSMRDRASHICLATRVGECMYHCFLRGKFSA